MSRWVLAGIVYPVADVDGADVAVVGARRLGRLLHVRGAGRTGSGARLRAIALARGGAADRDRRFEGIGRTRSARPVARLGEVAVPGHRAAHGRRRGLRIRRAARARAGAELRRVTGP